MSEASCSDTNDAPALIDPFGRRIGYLRLSVTDKCNLRCFYCIPRGFKDFEAPENWLTFDEIERVTAAFSALGVSRVLPCLSFRAADSSHPDMTPWT